MDITSKQKAKVDRLLGEIKEHYFQNGGGIAARNKWFYGKPVGAIYAIVNSVERHNLPNRDGYFSPIAFKSLVLSNISIEPKFVGRGIYRYIYADLETWCDQNRVHLVLENIMEHKFALFHQRQGFKCFHGELPENKSEYLITSMYRPLMTPAKAA